MEKYSEYAWGDILIQYWKEPTTEVIGLVLIPARLASDVVERKDSAIDSMIQVKLVGDDYPSGFAQGRTMRNSASISKFRFVRQEFIQDGENLEIVTLFQHESSTCEIEHRLSAFARYQALESKTSIVNLSGEDLHIEMLSSFSLGGITPFALGDTPCTLNIHRLRSKWSNEGRLETRSAEELQLEPTWSKHGVASERFGQVGSMPVRGYFPFLAVEDTAKNVVWAVQLAVTGSWQLEAYRRDNALCISGGLADREFGHWLKTLKPKEKFATPVSYLTVYEGGLDQASQRLTQFHERLLDNIPEIESQLPVIFNEFCTTWGKPSQENLSRIANTLKDKGITYCVIDAGWYAEIGKGWESNMGDWRVSPELFPLGLEAAVDEIRKQGLIPGIWFELENCGPLADAYLMTEHLLKRDGIAITSGQRRFWDFRDSWVNEYLADRVIEFLKKYGFGYLKIDYNETIGIGCDGAESYGEGLRQHLEAVQSFWRRIQREIPELVIENCSSGGHRLEPSMIGLSAMSSFSDAHEEEEIPIIAANMHRVMLPRQSQIWAVLRKTDSEQRLIYSLVNTFLGRMCLSGDINSLNKDQWSVVERGIAFYKEITPIIKDGISYRYGPEIFSYRHPKGWQALIRTNRSRTEAYAAIHTFGGQFPNEINITVPLDGVCQIENRFMSESNIIAISNNILTFCPQGPFNAAAVRLSLKAH